ncbi:MAG TPA: DUF1015 family protein [Verrucomicrobiae bacterium]|jgi:uncharacterized protein (DUF1015 family)|nr:DUF1015 family protein [Verrucomicrobiae bacterium]
MAQIKPFAALRPRPLLANKICEPPYDVMSSAEARVMASGNPLSFLHVSKPEIDLPENIDLYDASVYAKGSENFSRMIAEGALQKEKQPCFYFYRQIMGRHSQTGLVAVASCEDYLKGIVKKHEFTRPDKEDDRVRHMEALNSQTGPVFLVYRAVPQMDKLAAVHEAQTPDTDFTAADGIRHTSWTVSDPAATKAISAAFAATPSLYIADGHHRSAAAARVYQARKGAGESAWFLSVIFPDNQVQILPYNRVLKSLPGVKAPELLKKLQSIFQVSASGAGQPAAKHELGLYLDGQWHSLRFRPELTAGQSALDSLDVSLLQKHVLAPIFGVEDPRTSKGIQFVGGIRGTAELEKLVNTKEYACAFSMYPTGIEDLMAIADAGGVMPPKSTWFEPKLRDAMFCHML